MDIELRERLKQAGVGWESAMERFLNNETLYERFLRKFIADESFQGLLQAMEEKKYEEAFKFAHTFKGLTGNLSLDSLYQNIQPIVEELRAGNGDGVEKIIEQIKKDYTEICDIIKEI